MKKTILITLLALLGMIQMVAQEYEYVPFVREGVKWVYAFCGDYQPMSDTPSEVSYLNLEFKGDTVINGKTYKLMHKYHGESINSESDTVPVCMREENKVVYALVPDGKTYYDCPIYGNYWKPSDLESIREGKEFILYDFKNPIAYWMDFANSYMTTFELIFTNIITIGNHHVKRYGGDIQYLGGIRVIEGIGMEARNTYPLSFFLPMYAGSSGYMAVKLIRVIEDGEIIYDPDDYDWNEEVKDRIGYRYVPFVREGVKWVYYYNNPFADGVLNMPEGVQYYSFEFKGSKVINGKEYSPVVLKAYNSNGESVLQDIVPAYLREQDKVVYALLPEGNWYPQCPVGLGKYVGYEGISGNVIPDEEFILYDFNDPIELYDGLFPPIWWDEYEMYIDQIIYNNTDMLSIGDRSRKCHHYRTIHYNDDRIIEGIGYDGYAGFPLFYFEKLIAGFQVDYRLSHVVEGDEIIYKGMYYNPDIHVGIDEVVADKSPRPQDDNYYNLMGQPVGKDVPTAPGIYIHNGKKIIVR